MYQFSLEVENQAVQAVRTKSFLLRIKDPLIRIVAISGCTGANPVAYGHISKKGPNMPEGAVEMIVRTFSP